MNKLVSIIVPIYNSEQFLKKCIDSLINQTYGEIEILLIDDGSTDKSSEICDWYSKNYKNIKSFHLKNGGVSKARNFGINNCNGEYIQFVDADDFVENDYVEYMMGLNENGKSDLVICGINKVEYKNTAYTTLGKITINKKHKYDKYSLKSIMADLINNSYINYCYSKLIRRDVIIKNNLLFDENINLGEDTIFVLNIIEKANEIVIDSNTPYNYVLHSKETLTYKIRDNKFEILNNLSKYIKKICINNDWYNEEVEYELSRRYFNTIRFCIEENLCFSKSFNLRKRIRCILNIFKNDSVQEFISNYKVNCMKNEKYIAKSIEQKSIILYLLTYYGDILKRKVKG